MEDATILFADIKGFTPIASALSPEELVQTLNELFKAFDDLVEDHEVEKIKTIGDSYMVASGIPKPAARSSDYRSGVSSKNAGSCGDHPFIRIFRYKFASVSTAVR
jgi:class 3 adenylate cyclase